MSIISNLQRVIGMRGTKTNIEALSADLEEQTAAYATDTEEIGIYTNGGWIWVNGGGVTGAADSGWVDPDETWTYASADDPTFTFTISGDQTGKYSAGMRIKLTQTTVRYFIVTKVAYSDPNTTITIYGGTDYDLADAAIANNYYSTAKAPATFPLDQTKWTIEVSDTSNRNQTSPTQNVWYNPGSITISIPIGSWKVSYKAMIWQNEAALVTTCITLSTANNSESDVDFTAAQAGQSTSEICPVFVEKHLLLAAKTSYYLNVETINANVDAIGIRGDRGKTIIRSVCAYL